VGRLRLYLRRRTAAVAGHGKVFQASVQRIGPYVNFGHRFIHRETCITHSVLQEAVKVVNFVKARLLNSRFFVVLCDEMQADHKCFFHFRECVDYGGVKAVPLRSIEAHLGDRRYSSSYSFLPSALEGGEWSASRPGRALPPGKEPPVPTGPQSRSGRRG
jgi:hypothetical protein